MRRSVSSIRRNEEGASLVEFALIFPLFAILTLGLIDLGAVLWQFQQGTLAAQRGVRIAVTRDLLTAGAFPDCGPTTTGPPGTLCSAIPDYNIWGSCDGTQADTAPCGADVADVVTAIQDFYPVAGDDDIVIEFSGGGLGFIGLGKPVPVVTVRLTGVQIDLPILGAFGFGPVTMPDFAATAAAEDLTNGPG